MGEYWQLVEPVVWFAILALVACVISVFVTIWLHWDSDNKTDKRPPERKRRRPF